MLCSRDNSLAEEVSPYVYVVTFFAEFMFYDSFRLQLSIFDPLLLGLYNCKHKNF